MLYFCIMKNRILNLAKATCGIAVSSVIGFILMKLAFAAVCWINGHDMFESLLGMIGSIGFGMAIGVESYLWFRDWRMQRSRQQSR